MKNCNNINTTGRFSILVFILSILLISGCTTLQQQDAIPGDPVVVPFIKNSPNECYYLDEFMPTPDEMVTGKYGTLDIRYYTYMNASYKDWEREQIILSFYSRNNTCWSLFEEYYVKN